jgi:hypothetical protein
MARYSPELLAALRRRYEDTDQPMNALAADFGIGITTLQTLVRKQGWTQRSQRLRVCPPAMRLLEQAETLAAGLPERQSSAPQATANPALPLAGRASTFASADSTAPGAPPPDSNLSPVERIEALVVKEIEAEEAARAELALRPRARHDAERCARTLSVLTQTLQTLQQLRDGDAGRRSCDCGEEPRDMDALRNMLARRIEGLIENALGRERVLLDQQFAGLTDEQLKELAEVGRARGMQALLCPPEEPEDGKPDTGAMD